MGETAKQKKVASHMPASVFYEKIVPLLLALMGVLMLVLVLFAVGVLLGIVRF